MKYLWPYITWMVNEAEGLWSWILRKSYGMTLEEWFITGALTLVLGILCLFGYGSRKNF